MSILSNRDMRGNISESLLPWDSLHKKYGMAGAHLNDLLKCNVN
ncbi:hypothetical protein FHS09_003375 [Microbulbifer rhizosphaerae]|uniref:Uncharacterized protein n=1 Tax=Microbulbifer rhizosphaerae TaxID=1562603 RepID=A0A7W4WF89_9GAMM|nr:hypothetical protein [Microbulbifer rhizosphaerae]